MPVPEIEDLHGRHVAAIVPDHVDKAQRGNGGFHFMVIERIAIRVVLHYPAGMPAPAVAPEIQGVMVGGMIGFGPGDEIDQGLRIAHIPLTPIGGGASGVSDHSLGDMK